MFSHQATEIGAMRYFTSQLIATGNASQSEISRAVGVPLVLAHQPEPLSNGNVRQMESGKLKSMREHYGLDRLAEHGTGPLPETTQVVNPAWRALDGQVRSAVAKLSRAQFVFGAHTLDSQDNDPAAAARHEDARSFIGGLLTTSVNLRPDRARCELRMEIHRQTNPIHDKTLEAICDELNATETIDPGSNLRVVCRAIRPSSFTRGQDV